MVRQINNRGAARLRRAREQAFVGETIDEGVQVRLGLNGVVDGEGLGIAALGQVAEDAGVGRRNGRLR